MFTIEHEFDATVVTLIDEVRQGSRPLFEDVVITAFDDRVVVSQASDDGDLLTAVVLSIGGLLYARHMARAFDRKWGRPEDWHRPSVG